MKTTNSNAGAAALALEVVGKTLLNGPTTIDAPLTLKGGEGDCGAVDSTNDAPLWVGTGNNTGMVVLGNTNENLRILSNDINVLGTIDGDNDDLEIGTTADTDDLILGRNGKDVNVVDDLNVGGVLLVGPGNADAQIDANGSAGIQDLKIGADSVHTDDIILGHGAATSVVDIKQTARMNSKGIVMNNAAAVDTALTGCGIIFNSNGHGNGASIDFYTLGALQGYLDSTGFRSDV